MSSLFSDIKGLHTDKELEPQIDFVPTKFSAKWFVLVEKAQTNSELFLMVWTYKKPNRVILILMVQGAFPAK